MPVANADPLVGQMIDGRFEVRARLGQGGMGTVYRAWQRSVDREVAIKLMDVGFSRDPTAVRRFEREAQLASKLSQPNTVSVFDFGKAADGRLFIAMELIRGRTLHKVLTGDGVFSVARAARIGVQICDALEAAHKLGIVHRDLKLENVMVLDDPPGRDLVKVLDFGLAKQLGDLDAKGTLDGIVVGTPRYMAPEIAIGGAMSPAADLYALGVLLAELVTGHPLWERNTLAELLVHKLQPHGALAGVPPGLHALVGALLDPKPELRPNAADTRAHLTALGDTSAPRGVVGSADQAAATVVERARFAASTGGARAGTARDPRPPSHTHRWGTVGLVLVGAIALGLVALGVFGARSSVPVQADARLVPPRHVDVVTAAPDAMPDPWLGDASAYEPDRIRIHVETSPRGGLIRIDGVVRGYAPVDLDQPPSPGASIEVTATWNMVVAKTTVQLDHSQNVRLAKSLVAAPSSHDVGCWESLKDDTRHCRDEYCVGHVDEPACWASADGARNR